MKFVLPHEVEVGKRYVVVQHFDTGPDSEVETSGECVKYEDEYMWIGSELLPALNLHPHVGMPNVEIWEQ